MPSTTSHRIRTRTPAGDRDGAYRHEVVRTLARYGLQPTMVMALVESVAQERFAKCRPQEVAPVLEALLALLQAYEARWKEAVS